MPCAWSVWHDETNSVLLAQAHPTMIKHLSSYGVPLYLPKDNVQISLSPKATYIYQVYNPNVYVISYIHTECHTRSAHPQARVQQATTTLHCLEMVCLTPGGSMVKLKNTAHPCVSKGTLESLWMALRGVKASLTAILKKNGHRCSWDSM